MEHIPQAFKATGSYVYAVFYDLALESILCNCTNALASSLLPSIRT